LDAQNGLTFTRPARRRSSPLSAGSSVLDALWIVAIILEQPAYALIIPSKANPLLVLILLLQVLPRIKTQTDFVRRKNYRNSLILFGSPGTECPD
jgi:hypothetical protein